jgi:hypothetical protein
MAACLLGACGGDGSVDHADDGGGDKALTLSLSVSPTAQSVAQSASATLSIEASPHAGSAARAAIADLKLDLKGSTLLVREDGGGQSPDDKIGYRFQPVDRGAGRFSLTLEVGAEVATGDYDLSVTGEAGSDVTVKAATLTLSVTAPATHSGMVVTDQVVSLADHAQSEVPVTFGQIFKAGDVPAGATLSATLDGQSVPLQVDAKASNPDGSLRHAVLTALVPVLPASATAPLAISVADGGGASGSAVQLSRLLATNYDATVSINTQAGEHYTANARELLEAALEDDSCKPWGGQCNVWLSGPLVGAWVVHGPVTNEAGASDPNLSIYFAVRVYTDGASNIRQVRTDIIVENTWAYVAQAQPRYTATLTSGGESYISPALTQYTATRWHKVLWWNEDKPRVYPRQNTGYIQASRAVSRYMDLTPDADFLADMRQACPPLDHCDQTRHMGNTGAQAAIGPLPRWTSVYILDPDVRAYRAMLANTDALGAYGIHYRDQATGWPLSIHKHPWVTIADWSWASRSGNPKYKKDLLPNCTNNDVVKHCTTAWYGTGNPYSWDNAHQPAEGYVAYMVTGSWYYMSELAFGASHNELWPNESYRGHEQGLIDPSHSQIRGKAWVLREMVNAAYLLPDDYPLKAEFNADANNSIADFNASYTDNPDASPLGLPMHAIYPLHGHKKVGIAPWQHDFLTWSAGHAAELGFAGAADFRDWLAKFEIGAMTDWQDDPATGYCWLNASVYKLQVEDADHNWLPSLAAMRAATFPTLAGLDCNSEAFVEAMADLTGKSWQPGKMSGYPYSATGFPANFQIGIATAADTGLPKAHEAWEIFRSRSVKPLPPNHPAYNDYPNFAVIPRSE